MKRILFLVAILMVSGGCKKFLSKRSDTIQETPSSVADYQSLLDNDLVTIKATPALGVLGADDYILDSAAQQVIQAGQIGAYSWNAALYLVPGVTDNSWINPYEAIYQCNVVIHGLELVPHKEASDLALYELVRSRALFARAFHFFMLEETYGQPYRPMTSASDLGIPLRLDGDALAPVVRSSVKAVFDQIIGDLKIALAWLPPTPQPGAPNHPSRAATFALLARVALVQQDYTAARAYADSSLAIYSTLLKYDMVSNTNHPFDFANNPELLYQCSGFVYASLFSSATIVDTALYSSYVADDLRRDLYFQKLASGKGVGFKGYYSSGHFVFSGIAVDEVYLIRAECRARLQDDAGALADLNTLLSRRWKTGTYTPYANVADVLGLVLTERRKELVYREMRWSDLRRLNQDARLAITLKRIMGGASVLLPPNDPRYAWKIPKVETDLSHIQQNPD
ncbi:MAG: RagB/SusD family nutrient uptake outer membrane protein [Bacteroidetes bacterium]|nr:RagB/SusD family nutrient uptake outer membrane protein [Bacteroidota bacterium]